MHRDAATSVGVAGVGCAAEGQKLMCGKLRRTDLGSVFLLFGLVRTASRDIPSSCGSVCEPVQDGEPPRAANTVVDREEALKKAVPQKK